MCLEDDIRALLHIYLKNFLIVTNAILYNSCLKINCAVFPKESYNEHNVLRLPNVELVCGFCWTI